MKQLIKYLFRLSRQSRLPHLETSLVTKTDAAIAPDEIRLVLMTGLVRDEAGARALLLRYNVTTAAELLPLLPKPRPPVLRRLRAWIQLLEGAYSSDPHLDELHYRRTIGFETDPDREL